MALGSTELSRSGCPHLEKAYWSGEGVLPPTHAAPSTKEKVAAS
jgi:hypothetical protein